MVPYSSLSSGVNNCLSFAASFCLTSCPNFSFKYGMATKARDGTRSGRLYARRGN